MVSVGLVIIRIVRRTRWPTRADATRLRYPAKAGCSGDPSQVSGHSRMDGRTRPGQRLWIDRVCGSVHRPAQCQTVKTRPFHCWELRADRSTRTVPSVDSATSEETVELFVHVGDVQSLGDLPLNTPGTHHHQRRRLGTHGRNRFGIAGWLVHRRDENEAAAATEALPVPSLLA